MYYYFTYENLPVKHAIYSKVGSLYAPGVPISFLGTDGTLYTSCLYIRDAAVPTSFLSRVSSTR